MSCGKKKKQAKVDAQYHDKYVTSNLDGIQEKKGWTTTFSRAHWSCGARIEEQRGWIWEEGEPPRWKLGSFKSETLRDDGGEDAQPR